MKKFNILEKIKKYWYFAILSLLFAPIGSIITYFLLRKKDREAAILFLFIGLFFAVMGLAINGFF